MKFALIFLVFIQGIASLSSLASEAAGDADAAVATLTAGVDAHPGQAVVLFEDALQTNPDSRRELFVAAIELTGRNPGILARLIRVARNEFTEEDNLFAEAAMTTAPDLASTIREAFLAAPETDESLFGDADRNNMAPNDVSPDGRSVDEEIRDAIARMAAKAAGKSWPEQNLSEEPLHFRKPDEVRVSADSEYADESSLVSGLLIDEVDEREISARPIMIDDFRKPSMAIQLDESKFTGEDRNASTSPLDVSMKSIAPAGEVQIPTRPTLDRSSVYHIAPANAPYRSTIDRESGETPMPPQIIRPEPTSPTLPQ